MAYQPPSPYSLPVPRHSTARRHTSRWAGRCYAHLPAGTALYTKSYRTMTLTRIIRSRLLIMASISLLALAFALPSTARRQRTTRHGLTERLQYSYQVSDTLAANPDSLITFSGYDKTLRSHKETILAFNGSKDTITALSIKLTYLDMQGHQLHVRHVTLRQPLPPGERRMFTFPSWDKQNSYYFHRSEPGRLRYQSVTPYQIKIKALRAYITRKRRSISSQDSASADSITPKNATPRYDSLR